MKKERKKFLKLLIVLFITIFLIVPNYANASGLSWSDIEGQAKDFIAQGENTAPDVNDEIEDIVVPVAQMLVSFGNIVLVVAITVIGIKYTMATPDTKAKLKTQLIGVVVATIVIFGAQIIWSLLYEFLSDF